MQASSRRAGAWFNDAARKQLCCIKAFSYCEIRLYLEKGTLLI